MMMMMTLAAVQAYSELTCSFLLMNVDASPDRTVVGCRGETKSILPNVCRAASSSQSVSHTFTVAIIFHCHTDLLIMLSDFLHNRE